MSGYRFCRSDDVPLLVRAHNECYVPHLPGLEPLTEERFKRLIRELQIWTSSCMVAYSGERLIGVLLAAKRDAANWIYRVGVHPEFRRQGHGRHLMTSLSQKLAILGPRRLLAEVPADWVDARAFVEALGYRRQARYVDYSADSGATPAQPASDLVVPTTTAELQANGVLAERQGICWEGSPEAIERLGDGVRGVAVVSPDRVEAWLLYHDRSGDDERRILAIGATAGPSARQFLGLLIGHCLATAQRRVTIRRLEASEVPAEWLAGWGFDAGAETLGFASQAAPS